MSTPAATSPPERTGACLCGAIKYRQVGESAYDTVCHCIPCRRWTGSVAFAAAICPKEVRTLTTKRCYREEQKKKRRTRSTQSLPTQSPPTTTTIKMTRSLKISKSHPSQLSHRNPNKPNSRPSQTLTQKKSTNPIIHPDPNNPIFHFNPIVHPKAQFQTLRFLSQPKTTMSYPQTHSQI
jgi:hypothetical protein